MLRANQLDAIYSSINNNFSSGIHFHATGTGKSWIAMNILLEYNKRNPKHNILWLCEKKSILIDQFNEDNIRERNFEEILKKFNIINLAEKKIKCWYDRVNEYNKKKPILLIINRAYLTTNKNYEKINLNIHMIIHDECHTMNKSTREFYNYMYEKKNNYIIKSIGFSATPKLEYKPYDNVISSYSIYDAFLDNVIVRPKIKWLTYDGILNYQEIVTIMKDIINKSELNYKKIVIWCGMIDLSIEMAKLWTRYFEDYLICIDTSKNTKDNKDNNEFKTYDDFCKAESKSILFCANKHREGSDIKNLDCCIFLDKVQNRCPKLFIQCIGRVLRMNVNKKYGLIIDLRARNSYNICNNINNYLELKDDIYPWSYDYEVIKNKDKIVKINTLDMVKYEEKQKENKIKKEEENKYTIKDLEKLYIRKIPVEDQKYKERLNHELELLSSKNLISYLIQAIDILKITNNIPHITRGSCGSSLVCYLLGISHVDPVKYNIKFARFLNEYRNNLPDIDLDFPHNIRDEVFVKIQLKWPNKVARISNHVYFHEKSALRQAFRNVGIRKFIGKNEIQKELDKQKKDIKNKIIDEKKKLENTFRCYSLHCGGIVYFSEGIPQKLLLNKDKYNNKNNLIPQITLNKYDIAKEKNFKIDILSSRALSQCYEINQYNPINFEEFKYDKKTFDMLSNGDNLGIILGESPLIRKAFIKIKPKNLYDIAVCLSIIRPAAKDARKSIEIGDLNENIIFDDDAIDMIASEFKISDAEADKYRRGFAKGSYEVINEFRKLLKDLPRERQRLTMQKFANLSRYGFCKSHALSYAQLIYKLAYLKANKPLEFWKGTLNNCVSSYKKWVHLYEAKIAGVDISNIHNNKDVSIYALNRKKKINNLTLKEQLGKYGYWNITNDDFFPGCFLNIKNNVYEFNGIIASHRMIRFNKEKKLMLFIGVEKKKYIQLNISNVKFFNNKFIGISGKGSPSDLLNKECSIIDVSEYKFY